MSLTPQLIARMTEWRRHMHRFPECGFNLPLTADFIAEKLESFGIEVTRHIGQQGIVGVLRFGKGDASIGLRADMDALFIHEGNEFEHRSRHDGQMHACGHDGHSAMLLGAASYLAETKDFNGTVHFIFQPDEEHGQGAQAMIDDGLFERFRIDAIYGLHNMPGLPEGQFMVRPGSLMASESSFEIVIKGVGGHAAMPHRGIDPIVVGSQIILGLQTIVSRNLSAIEETAVVSATEFVTNGTVNVIPSEVTIKGDCRCFTEDSLKRIEACMERIVSGICQAAGAHYSFTFVNTFYPTVNSPLQTEHATRAAIAVLGSDNVEANCLPLTISEDFSSMLRIKPGCYALLGNGVESVGGCALHNPEYDFNDHILKHGAQYWVQLVRDQLK
ncbi:M20 aminoacylase family protein [Neptunomonas antarctica]|uniref:Hippurate hydrolase n=1 Tax=Neptunomonas antarctica TaxID=619304 RepID=A0A1N7L3S1_9GAMM|nr:M20 aminoacylase family protein [Neptunomonas antarctica]SIS68426.1 hippurate hydrolase [Neptunomonas antarctica]